MTTKNFAVQEDMFSMFGIVDEYAEKKKREEEERQRQAEELRKKAEEARAATKGSSSTNNKVEKQDEDKFEVNENTVIRYYGESIDIQSYFSAEEIAEGILVKKSDEETERKPIDGETLRKRMEKDYPELIKNMTEMVYLKDKNIVVPVMKAKKKGNWNCIETSSYEGVSSFSKIPYSILRDFIAVARLYTECELEIHADIYLDSKGKYFLDVPSQQVSRLWCKVTESSYSIASRVLDAIKVMEIHSHHIMPAIPSEIDNAAERIPGMIYAIVGKVNQPFPDIRIRRFISEEVTWIPVKYDSIFEDPFMSLPSSVAFNNVEVVG